MSPKTPKEEIKKTKPVSAQTSVGTKTNHKTDISEPDKTQTSPKTKKEHKPRTTGQKVLLWVLALLFIFIAAGVGVFVYFAFFRPNPEDATNGNQPDFPDPIYSLLTGEEISDASLNQKPTFCVQIPNGNDGGRPQAGLNQAAVVFEAIAERGITRFAAIFQNPTVGAIGPIRSLRSYYLDWDTPFDCTIVHAGGSDEALADLRRSGQRDLDESNTYMWRENNSGRMWNNLFTSPANLAQFNETKGYNTSSPKVFPRLTPEDVDNIITERDTCAEGEDCINIIDTVRLQFGASPTFNTVYKYDPETNKYLRSYASGEPHVSYECPANLPEPNTKTQCGEPVQLTPSVVVAMVVQERPDYDGYHEKITAIGTGPATIFQNGQVIEGSWTKSSQTSQIIFRNANGDNIQFTPGQVWIAAIPQTGRIEY